MSKVSAADLQLKEVSVIGVPVVLNYPDDRKPKERISLPPLLVATGALLLVSLSISTVILTYMIFHSYNQPCFDKHGVSQTGSGLPGEKVCGIQDDSRRPKAPSGWDKPEWKKAVNSGSIPPLMSGKY